MHDSPFTEAEPPVQPRFSKVGFFQSLLLFCAVLAGRSLIVDTADRVELGPSSAIVRYRPVEFDPAGFAPLRLAGAWVVSVDDPRFGGVSALALERDRLLALTDSGVVVSLPRPGEGSRASLRDLPSGPGDPGFKRNRDSEALLRDPRGRGWWVAFENRHSLWLYDPTFAQGRRVADLGDRGWRANKGVEAIALDGDRLLLLVETGDEMVSLEPSGPRTLRLPDNPRRISDASVLPDGGMLVLQRQSTALGLRNWLARLESTPDGYRVAGRIALGVGRLDVLEGLAVEKRPQGIRLWVMSDDNFRRHQRTLLLALDVPPRR